MQQSRKQGCSEHSKQEFFQMRKKQALFGMSVETTFLNGSGLDAEVMQERVSDTHMRFSMQENTEEWPWEAVVLIGWLIFFRYLVYIALRYKTAAPEAKHH